MASSYLRINEHSNSDFSDSKITVQIIKKERQTKNFAGYLTRLRKIIYNPSKQGLTRT